MSGIKIGNRTGNDSGLQILILTNDGGGSIVSHLFCAYKKGAHTNSIWGVDLLKEYIIIIYER